jgi:hypothetical protein
MDNVKLVIDRTVEGLQKKIKAAYAERYRCEGSFTRTPNGRWFMQTMVLMPPFPPERGEEVPVRTKTSPKAATAKSGAKRSHHKKKKDQ